MERLFFVFLVSFGIFVYACGNRHEDTGSHKYPVRERYYTCPMHPDVRSDKAGSCSVCKMDLVQKEKGQESFNLSLDSSQIVLANITVRKADEGSVRIIRHLNGHITQDPNQTLSVTSRVKGRIDKLYYKEEGIPVKKGTPLYVIYSEKLATLQQEYLLALSQLEPEADNPYFREIRKTAKQKLLLYDFSEKNIARLEKEKTASPYSIFYAPKNGVIANLKIVEGSYVEEGSPILRIENYENLWVEANVYPSELPYVKIGANVQVVIPSAGDKPISMRVAFIEPEMNPNTQTVTIRGSIKNYYNEWQPGMEANIILPVYSNAKNIIIPTDAVIREEKAAHVWVKKGNVFVPVAVTLGEETLNQVEVKTGLLKGDDVVITGAYLLYSEYILKNGKSPMGKI